MASEKKAHKYFWVYVILVAALLFAMIYFTSTAQQKEEELYDAQKAESQQLANELNKEKNNSKQLSELNSGISQSVQTLQEENDTLKAEIKQKDKEIVNFTEETLAYKNFCSFLTAYVNGNLEECKSLKDSVNKKFLTDENVKVYNKICEEIK